MTLEARNLSVTSTILGASANAEMVIAGGGGVDVKVPSSNATSTTTTKAGIGANSHITATGAGGVGGNVTVRATGRAEADAYSAAWGGAAIAIGASFATATVNPTVTAVIGAGTTITASGDVTVTATVTRTPVSQQPPQDGEILGVDAPTDTLSVDFPLLTGDQVIYTASTAAQVGGLTPCTGVVAQCRVYPVTVLAPSVDGGAATVAFQQSFTLANVDGASDVIRFSSPHFFASGDAVRLLSGGGLGVVEGWQGIDEAGVLYVRVVDRYRIRLVTSHAAAIASVDSLLRGFTVASGGTYLTMSPGRRWPWATP